MKKTLLILMALSWPFSNASTASGYEFSDAETCEMLSIFSSDLQRVSLLLALRLSRMLEDEDKEAEPFAHPAREYLSILETLEKIGDFRHATKMELKRKCD